MANWKTNQDLIQKLYIAFYGRPADPGGLRYWASQLPDNAAPDSAATKELISRFINSEEAQSRFGNPPLNAVIDRVISAAFNRNTTDADKQGVNNPVDLLVKVVSVSSGPDYATLNAKLEYANWFVEILDPNGDGIANDDSTGTKFRATYNGNEDANKAAAKIKLVDAANPSTKSMVLNDIKTTIADTGDAVITQPDPAQTYNLTQGPDTATANKFIAKPVVNAFGNEVQTLSSADTLTGTGTNPTLEVLWTGGATTVAPTMTGIETLKVSNLGTGLLTLTGNNVTGVKNIVIDGSTNDFTANNLQTKVEKVSIINTATDTTVQVAASALSGSSDEVEVVLDKALEGSSLALDSTGTNGYEKIKVKVENNASTIDQITSNTTSTKTITFEGDKDLTLRGNGANPLSTAANSDFTTIDASAMTGKFTLGGVRQTAINVSGAFAAAATAKGSVVIKGGSKDDTFVISDLGEKYSIDGGDGNDTLIVTDAAGSAGNPGNVATAPKLTSIETLKVLRGDGNGVAANVSLNLLGVSGIKTLELGKSGTAANIITLNNLTHNNDFTIKAVGTGQAGNQTFNGVNYSPLGVTGTSDKVTIEIGNKGTSIGAGNSITVGNITLGGIENVSMSVKDLSSTSTANFGTFTANNLKNFELVIEGGKANAGSVTFGGGSAFGSGGSLSTFKLVSDAGVTISLSQANGASFEISGAGAHNVTANAAGSVVINAADTTGGVTLTGNAGADTIIGGSGNDILQGGDGNDQIDLTNGGTDTVRLTGTAAMTSAANAGGTDTVIAFQAGTGGDILQFGSTWLNGVAFTSASFSAGASGGLAVGNSNYIYVVNDNGTAATPASVATLASNFSAAGSQKALFIINDGSGNAGIWYIDDSLDGTATNVTATDVVLIGVLQSVNAANLVAANFAGTAV